MPYQNRFSLMLIRFLFISSLSILAPLNFVDAKTCLEFLQVKDLQFPNDSDMVAKFDHAYLLSRKGQFEESRKILEEIRKHISYTPIVKTFPKKLGSHGGYKAQLEDGTLVLIKPFASDLYSSIPKEVGMSKLFDLIGLPIIPVAGYRRDPVTNTWASVHLFLPDTKAESILSIIKEILFSHEKRTVQERQQVFGTEINFILLVTGYAKSEMSQRHALRRTLPDSTDVKYLIDMGSALIDASFDLPKQEDLKYFDIPQLTLERIRYLTLEDFLQELDPYFPKQVTKNLYNRLQLMAQVLDPSSDYFKIYASFISENYFSNYYTQQFWSWLNAKTPPPEIRER